MHYLVNHKMVNWLPDGHVAMNWYDDKKIFTRWRAGQIDPGLVADLARFHHRVAKSGLLVPGRGGPGHYVMWLERIDSLLLPDDRFIVQTRLWDDGTRYFEFLIRDDMITLPMLGELNGHAMQTYAQRPQPVEQMLMCENRMHREPATVHPTGRWISRA